jgi:hypothetical protein
MSNRQQEAWGGEVRMPRWLRRMLRRPEPLGDSPEGAHEARTGQAPKVGPDGVPAEVLGSGALSDLHRDRRR